MLQLIMIYAPKKFQNALLIGFSLLCHLQDEQRRNVEEMGPFTQH